MRDERGVLGALLENGAKALDINLPTGAIAAFASYHKLLERRSRNVNLTAITGVEDVARLHFLDSLALLNAAQFLGSRVIDIGSGAGFPGIAIKIAEPSVDLTLLDASGKRVSFLSELIAALGLDADCICARAEDAVRSPSSHREKYDIAVSRAVARLNILCELCLPYVRVGGLFIAMKGIDSADEISEARGAIESLGAEFHECFDYIIPETEISHRAVLIKKTSETPTNYPRRFARIQNAPL